MQEISHSCAQSLTPIHPILHGQLYYIATCTCNCVSFLKFHITSFHLLLHHTYYLCLLRYHGGVVDNQFRQEDGSYFVPNINPSDGTYASADGVEYYCTASNDFGTIRSRNATASIARKWRCGCLACADESSIC